MGWETRIFFDISDNEQVKEQLTLRHGDVAATVLPGMTSLCHERTEKRRDDYVLLTDNCPHAIEIGIKARNVQQGSNYTLVELKTAVSPKDDEKDDDTTKLRSHDNALANWTKSGQYCHGDLSNKQVLSDFLKGRLYQPLASIVSNWLEEEYSKDHVPIMYAQKKRRRAKLGPLDVEETDIVFSTHGCNSSDTPLSIKLRSWAVEGRKTDTLVDIATSWPKRFHEALAVTGMDKTPPPRMWIASYPRMVVLLSEMLPAVSVCTTTKKSQCP